MIIQKRVCSSKRRTIGYIVDGTFLSKGEVVRLAKSNKIDNVTARRGAHGWYVASKRNGDRRLLDIITVIDKGA